MLRALSVGIALTIAGCGPSPVPSPFPPCGGGPCTRDASTPALDSSLPPPPFDLCAALGFGGGCDDACAGGLSCFRERRTTATATRTADGGVDPDGGVADAGVTDGSIDDAGIGPSPALEVVAFPGGLCSAPCASDADCGGCATCVPHALAGRARLRGVVGGSGVCRRSCSPDVPGSCAPGYACDPDTRACLEACTSTEQCRFRTEDVDGDGDDDVLVYDPDPEVACSPTTGRCEVPPAALGGPCRATFECDPGYWCSTPDGGGDGVCALPCEGDPSICGDDARCAFSSALGVRVCSPRCTVGADAPEHITGSDGRGAGCLPMFRCVWDGLGPAPDGACVAGRYNDVPGPNLGAPCTSDDGCWSPYGRGVCLAPDPRTPEGVCSVIDCVPDAAGAPGLVPGVPVADLAAFCDPAGGLSCVSLTTLASESACIDACTSADECMPGWACTRLLGTEVRACAPTCADDDECRAGGRCQHVDTAPCGDRAGACYCR